MTKLFRAADFDEALKISLIEAHKQNPKSTPEELIKLGYEKFCSYNFKLNKKVFNKTTEKMEDKIVQGVDMLAQATNNSFPLYKRIADLSMIPTNNPFRHKSDVNKFINAAKQLFPNIDAYNAGNVLTTLRMVIENIYANLGDPKAKKQQISFYQYSAKGATGKSNFLDKLQNFCNAYQLPNGTPNIVGRWINNEMSYNLVSVVKEFMPRKRDNEETIENLNNIIDNEEYKVEGKGKEPYYIHSKTTLFINSNRTPFDVNDRRYGVIKYNEIPYPKIKQEDKETYFPERAEKEWNKIFLQLFESCPFGKSFEDPFKRNSENIDGFIFKVKDITENPANQMDDLNEATIRFFVDRYCFNKDIKDLSIKKAIQYEVENAIYQLVADEKITPVKRVNGDLKYSRYNWFEIADLKTNEDDSDSDTSHLDNVQNIFERTQKAFEYFLEETPTTPTDDGTFDALDDFMTDEETQGVEEELEELEGVEEELELFDYIEEPKFSYKDAYQTLSTNNEDDQFETINNCYGFGKLDEIAGVTEQHELTRKDDNVSSMRNFVFEGDELSLAEQKELIKENKDVINRVVFSGSKSLHCRITINFEPESKQEYKWIHNYLNNKYFNGTSDKACSNPSRLTRRPNGIRDNGAKQTLLFKSNTVLKCEELHEIYLKEKEVNDLLKDFNQTTSSYERKTDSIIDELELMSEATQQTETWQNAYDIATGIGNYDGVWSALGFYNWMGFSADEILDQVEFKSWNISKQTIEKFLER